MYIATIYLVQVLKVLLTKFLHGYQRGKTIYIVELIQFIVQTNLVIWFLVYYSFFTDALWIVWELMIFILA